MSSVYIDSNVFLHPVVHDPKAVPKAARARVKLEQLAAGPARAYTSTLTWDEVVWTVRKLFGQEAAIAQGGLLLTAPNLWFLSVDREAISTAQALAERHGLKPRDCIHAATALTNRISHILSYDPDFDVVPGLIRSEP